MEGKDIFIKRKIKTDLTNFKQHFQKIKRAASNVFSLEQGISSKKPESPFPFFLTFSEEEKDANKKEMISQLVGNYLNLISYLENMVKSLTSNVKNKDAFYYGLLNDINEYISKLNNICFDCKRIDKYYNLKTSKNLPDIKNFTYKEYSVEFKYMPTNFLFFKLNPGGFKFEPEDNYDTNINVKELKQKCGKTLSNNYDIISNGYTMRNRSFFINKKLRDNGFDSLTESDKKVIKSLSDTCFLNPCYKNMILFRFVDQNFIKNLFDIEFLNYSESSVSDAVCKLQNYWVKMGTPIKLEGGFISASYIYSKNLFQNRDVLLKLYVPFGTPIYATDNDQESEVIITAGVNYVFFDAYYEKVIKLNEYFFRLVIKAFIKPTPFSFINNVKNPPPIIVLNF